MKLVKDDLMCEIKDFLNPQEQLLSFFAYAQYYTFINMCLNQSVFVFFKE